MQTITQREFRNGSAAVMDAVEQGETFQITRRGVAIAEVRPLQGETFALVSDVKRRFAGLPAGDHDAMRQESDEALGEDRIGG